jgi:hypothetical protein
VVLSYDGDECLIWPYGKTRGYARIRHAGREGLVSRLICEREYGPPPTASHEAAHSCGRGKLGCVAKRHLRWATRTENEADKLMHGTHNRGERQGGAKLTRDGVIAIRALASRAQQKDIAAKFGISEAQVSRIVNGETWRWLHRDGVAHGR